MIAAAVVCPHPPLLFRELAGQRDVLADLRAACRSTIRAATGGAVDRVIVVGGAEDAGTWDPSLDPAVRGFGTAGSRDATGLPPSPVQPLSPRLPLSLGVGKRLLGEAGWAGAVEMVAIASDASPSDIDKVADDLAARPQQMALLVMGDGSARRGNTAPGYLDGRAFDFDEATGRALAGGDADALLAMDADLAEELMVAGRAAFQVLAAATRRQGTRPRASMTYQDDPYEVMYYVALWEL